MKKQITIILGSWFLILGSAQAQFVQGIGIMGGITIPKQKWWTTVSDGANFNTTVEKHKYIFVRYNGEIFGEFIDNPNMRWRTEFEYDAKGTKQKYTGEKNKVNYLSWNNYLIGRFETFYGFPYALLGPRVEYLMSQNTPSVPFAFKTFHFSWSAGAGFEFIAYGNFKPMAEFHYNPDFNYAMQVPIGVEGSQSIKNRAWEIRLGLIYRPGGKEDCPAVIY